MIKWHPSLYRQRKPRGSDTSVPRYLQGCGNKDTPGAQLFHIPASRLCRGPEKPKPKEIVMPEKNAAPKIDSNNCGNKARVAFTAKGSIKVNDEPEQTMELSYEFEATVENVRYALKMVAGVIQQVAGDAAAKLD